jgi:hypothetical protein
LGEESPDTMSQGRIARRDVLALRQGMTLEEIPAESA